MKLDTSSFFVKSQSAALQFCHLTSFAEENKETNFSVKSSWEVRLIKLFQKDVVWYGITAILNAYLHHKNEKNNSFKKDFNPL